MKTLFMTTIAAFLLIMSSGFCGADTMISDLTKEQAKDWGISVRSRTNGDAGIKVTLEFKTEGRLEKFGWVELRMNSGGKYLSSAPLAISRSTEQSISTGFSVVSTSLKECELWIYVDDIPLGGSGYRLKLKDFALTAPTADREKSTEAK